MLHRRIVILIPSVSRCIGINSPTRLGATLTFTPEIGGYWQVSVDCSVAGTNTTTNFQWKWAGAALNLNGSGWTASGANSPNPPTTTSPATEPTWTANIKSVTPAAITSVWERAEDQR